MKNKNKLLAVLGIVCILLVGLVVFTMFQDKKKVEKTITSSGTSSESNFITYKGVKYKKN